MPSAGKRAPRDSPSSHSIFAATGTARAPRTGRWSRTSLRRPAFLRDHPAVEGRSYLLSGLEHGRVLRAEGGTRGRLHGARASLPGERTGDPRRARWRPSAEPATHGGSAAARRSPPPRLGGTSPASGPTSSGRIASALAARVRCPVLLVHARADSVVPFGHSLALARHLAGDATLARPRRRHAHERSARPGHPPVDRPLAARPGQERMH